MRFGRRPCGVLLLVALPLLLAAGPVGYKIGPAPYRLLPSLTPAGEQKVMPGMVVATSVLGRPDAAIMVDAITLDQFGAKALFQRGTVLSSVSIPGLDGAKSGIFCENPTASGKRWCVFDSDGDARFDRALLTGATGRGNLPIVIPAAEFGLIEGLPIGGDSTLKLRYVGSGGEKGSVAFDLEAFAFGRMRPLAGSRRVVPIVRLPAHEIVAGAVITVLAYDTKSGEATVIVNRDFAPGHIVLPEFDPAA